MHVSDLKPTDSTRNDTTYYWIAEWKLLEMSKVSVDLEACKKARINDSLRISDLEAQKEEKNKKINFLDGQVATEEKKSKKLKWSVGGVSVIVGGLIIYSSIRK